MFRFTKIALVSAVLLGAGLASDAKAQFIPTYPSFPVIVSPTQVTGFNPYTGGLNTGNTVIHNSAFDPYRNFSAGIPGNLQPVSRPATGGGWEVGQQWYNPVTGQFHGNTQIIRPNGLGGVQTTQKFYSRSN